jgi:hypothetical protein
LVIPQIQLRDNVIPQLFNFIKTVKGWDVFSRFKLPKISCLFDNNLSPEVGGAPSQKPYLKCGTIENYLNGAVAFAIQQVQMSQNQSFI